jgi:hypothetical protein
MTEDDPKFKSGLVLHPAKLTANRCNGGFLYVQPPPRRQGAMITCKKRFNQICLQLDIKAHIKVTASDDSINMKLTFLTTSL